jgi:hypothetical protein
MNRWTAVTLTGGLLALVMSTLTVHAQESGYIRRFAATRLEMGGREISTNLPPGPSATGGLVIYNKNFFTANDINVIYVSISATGDAHFGSRIQLACLLDGNPCNPDGHSIGGAPTGWFTAQRHKDYNNNALPLPFVGDGGGGAGDLHDNVVAYTWCTPFNGPAGTHNVQVKLATNSAPGDPLSGAPAGEVFLVAVHFYIDGSRVADPNNRCPGNSGGSDAIDPSVAVAPSATLLPDGTWLDTTTFVPLALPSILTVPMIAQLPQ